MFLKEEIKQIKGFYQLPKFLFKKEKYKTMTTEAKTLYALFIDRIKLSIKNDFEDRNGNIYIIFSNEEIRKELNCCITTAIKVVKELKDKGLIVTKRQGLGKPNLIYLQKIEEYEEKITAIERTTSQATTKELVKEQVIQTTTKKPVEATSQTTTVKEPVAEATYKPEVEMYREVLKEQISYDVLVEQHKNAKEEIDEIVELMLEVSLCKEDVIKISKDNAVYTDLFKSRINKMTFMDLEYILHCFSENKSKIVNIKNYLLSTIYNCQATINHYYKNWVNSDMYNKCYGSV